MESETIYYSEKYFDSTYEYRHVILPKNMTRDIPRNKLLTESEWRKLGVQQSRGWVHYMVHVPEPHILLFRRPLSKDSQDSKKNSDKESKPVNQTGI